MSAALPPMFRPRPIGLSFELRGAPRPAGAHRRSEARSSEAVDFPPERPHLRRGPEPMLEVGAEKRRELQWAARQKQEALEAERHLTQRAEVGGRILQRVDRDPLRSGVAEAHLAVAAG